MKLNLITISFALLTLIPRGVIAADTTSINQCLKNIQENWFSQADVLFTGKTRVETPCMLSMKMNSSALKVQAKGSPLDVSFELTESNKATTRTLQSCKVDKEKIHFVFEEKLSGEFEKRTRVQMTLLKRHGKGISLILSQRENKFLLPLQQSSLICHLD